MSKLPVKMRRNPKGGSFTFLDLFEGFEEVGAIKKIFGMRAKHVLGKVKVNISQNKGYLRVDNDTGAITVCSPYLKSADEKYLYLDLIHELVHVRQHMEGKELFDKSYSYVDRPTEIEAYTVAVAEAWRIGMNYDDIVDYLRVEWVTDDDFRRMLENLEVSPRRDYPEK